MIGTGTFVEHRNHFIGKHILVHHFLAFPVDDLAAVIGQDKSAELIYTQLIGERHDAIGWPSRSEYQTDSLFLYAYQCFPVAGSYFFLRVGKRTVKVEDYNDKAKNNQQLEITAKVASVAEAKTKAEKYLRLHNKYAKTATFTLPGNLDIVAGVTAKLTGWGAWDGKYIVEQAAHSVGSSGYTTQVKLRKTLEGY